MIWLLLVTLAVAYLLGLCLVVMLEKGGRIAEQRERREKEWAYARADEWIAYVNEQTAAREKGGRV